MSEQHEIFFNFGDLVRVDGYWPRVFKVDGYRREHWVYPNEEWTDVVYELHDVGNLEFIEADMADLTLVETADKADAYLMANPPHYEATAPVRPDWVEDLTNFNAQLKANERREMEMTRKPTAREISAKEAEQKKAARKARGAEIDNLLDLRNWAADMLAKTNNEEFGDRVFAIDCELKKLTETI
jgi:hypothetical protein